MRPSVFGYAFAFLFLLHVVKGQEFNEDNIVLAVVIAVVLLGLAAGAVLVVVVVFVHWRRQKKKKNFLYKRRYNFSRRKLVRDNAIAAANDINSDDFTPSERVPRRPGSKTVSWSVDLVQASQKNISSGKDAQRQPDSKTRALQPPKQPTSHQLVTSSEPKPGPPRAEQNEALSDVDSRSNASQDKGNVSHSDTHQPTTSDAQISKEQDGEIAEFRGSGGGSENEGGVTISVETLPSSAKGQASTTSQASGGAASESPPKLKSILKALVKDSKSNNLQINPDTSSPVGKAGDKSEDSSKLQQSSAPSGDSDAKSRERHTVAGKSRSVPPPDSSQRPFSEQILPVHIDPLELDALVMDSQQRVTGASFDDSPHSKEETDHPLVDSRAATLEVDKDENTLLLEDLLPADQQSNPEDEVASGDREELFVSSSIDFDKQQDDDHFVGEERVLSDLNHESDSNSPKDPCQEEILLTDLTYKLEGQQLHDYSCLGDEPGFDEDNNGVVFQPHQEAAESPELKTSSTTNLLLESDDLDSQSGSEPVTVADRRMDSTQHPDTSTVLVFGQVDGDGDDADSDLQSWNGETSSQEDLIRARSSKPTHRQDLCKTASEDSDAYSDDDDDDENLISYI